MNTKYPNLLSPVRMNRLILKNRICAAPCGRVGIKAKGGASYVIVGNVSVKCEKSDMNPTAPYQLDAPQKHALVEKVSVAHFYGARVGAELLHVGMFSRVQRDDYSYGPCDTTVNGHVVKALNEKMEEIEVEGTELLARALCHELDHLDGVMYVTKVEGELYDTDSEEEEETEEQGEETSAEETAAAQAGKEERSDENTK